MNHVQKLLVVVVVGEMVEVLLLIAAHDKVPLPRLHLSRFASSKAADIERLADGMDRGSGEAWLHLADQYRSAGLFNEAAYCFERGYQLQPSLGEHRFYWAAALDRAGRFSEALPLYRECLAENKAPADRCWLAIGLVHLRLGDLSQAEEALRKSGLPLARLMLARPLARCGRAQEARALLEGLLREFPGDLRANQLRGFVEQELGNLPAARRFEDRAGRATNEISSVFHLALAGPEDEQRNALLGVNGAVRRAEELAASGQLLEAIALLRQIPREERPSIVYQRIAGWELALGQPRATIQTLRAGLDYLGPETGALLALLGAAYTSVEDHANAQAAWLQSAAIRGSPELHQLLATSFDTTGDVAASRRHQALADYEAGKLAWLRNDLSTARERFEVASHTLTDHAHTWFYLAETLRCLNDEMGARGAYEHCLRINPDHGRALRALARLSAKLP